MDKQIHMTSLVRTIDIFRDSFWTSIFGECSGGGGVTFGWMRDPYTMNCIKRQAQHELWRLVMYIELIACGV
jgi:hypothetical protein